jgi:hypothetical protein
MSINVNLIYNAAQYLKDEFPAETVYTNERWKIGTGVPERNILIRETGGSEAEVIEETAYQIIVRDIDNVSARELAYEVYEKFQSTAKINGRFGLILPATTVDGAAVSAVQTARITAIQRPESLGKDENGLSEFSMNFQIFL